MGNRGCLHDDHRRVVRRFAGRRWIVCVLEWKGRHRTVMTPRSYTELFFLDEATALAAGHRPCFECSRSSFYQFQDAWTRGNPGVASGAAATADEMDAVLHRERVARRDAGALPAADVSALPDGTMVVFDDGGDQPFLLRGDLVHPWSVTGYGPPRRSPGVTARVLTPPSTVAALAAGYRPRVHPSAAAT